MRKTPHDAAPLARLASDRRRSKGGTGMPSMSKDTGARTDWGDMGIEWRADLDGYVTSFVTVGTDVDLTPLLQGLPGDVCPSPHWGYVFKGRTWWRFADREETFGEGDAYYVP